MIETILSSRASSTRRLCGLKWNVFSMWGREHGLDPVNCLVASVLEFQDRFTAGLIPSTLKVCVAAFVAFHVPLDVGPLGKHQLVVRFIRGAWITVITRDVLLVIGTKFFHYSLVQVLGTPSHCYRSECATEEFLALL